MESERFDAIVLGAGQAGKPLAQAFAGAGKRTALVEREHVGGTCINVGCTPTKTMVASGRVAYLARRGADYGVRTTGLEVDLGRVRERKRAIVQSFRGGSEARLAKTEHLELVRGEARFVEPHAVEVRLTTGGTRRLEAPVIVINTGCRPLRPDVPGLAEVPFLDSTSVMELDAVPRHLVVLGGGYIGVEFAQMFRRFGSEVTIVQRGPRLLARVDDDVADAVADVLREDGLDLRLDHTVVRVARAGAEVAVTLADARGVEATVTGSHLLVAAGRVPNTEALGLSAAGVALDGRGFVKVDERLQTSAAGVYAAGDVNGGPAFTHVSYDDFRVLARNLLKGGAATTKDRLVPWTMFMDPQLAHVGMGEAEARAAGRDVRVAKMPMAHVARALEMDESRGFMKAVVDAKTEQILGFTVLGIEGGELMAVVEVAMLGGVRWPVLKDAVFAHPTLAESLNNLFALL